MSDLISRQATIDAFWELDIELRPSAIDAITGMLQELPSAQPERKKGKWDERSVFDTEDSDIAQMQSAKCSVCGKYHTTPYLYFFDNFNYCPNCGADMRGE